MVLSNAFWTRIFRKLLNVALLLVANISFFRSLETAMIGTAEVFIGFPSSSISGVDK